MTTTTLPDAAWRDAAGLARILAALGRDNMRVVGGAVRDALLGHHVTDIDIATTCLPHDVVAKLEAAGVKVIPTGIDHGTVTAISSGHSYEITTLRRDVETDGRRATIAYATLWQDDAARRDFTINALYADPISGEIYDYFGGLADLAAGRVIFIGDAATRIAEDHLRILRFYRFAARFGNDLDPVSHAAVVAARQSLKSLSRERICDELLKILALPDPRPIAAHMAADDIFGVLLPEIESVDSALGVLDRLIGNEQAVAGQGGIGGSEGSEGGAMAPSRAAALRRLAALLPADDAVAEQVASRLRLSKRQRTHLRLLSRHRTDQATGIRQLAYHLGMDAAWDLALLRGDVAQSLSDSQRLHGWQVPQLPLKGGDIVARGLARGPQVADLLKAVEAAWLAEDFPDQARVMALLDDKASAQQAMD